MHETTGHQHGHGGAKAAGEGGLIDPVCGMTVRPGGAHTATVDGVDYAFCCGGCKASSSRTRRSTWRRSTRCAG